MERIEQRGRWPQPKDFFSFLPPEPQLVDVEIGCGVGLHPIQYAQAHPERTLIAFERTEAKFSKFANRMANHPSITNLRAIRGDGFVWLHHGCSDGRLSRIFLLYPNPYPKPSQRSLRFSAPAARAELERCLALGGEVILATNVSAYAEEFRASLLEGGCFCLVEQKSLSSNSLGRTHFERKYLERGEECIELIFRKNRGR